MFGAQVERRKQFNNSLGTIQWKQTFIVLIRWQIVSQTTGPADFKCLHVKSKSVWHLSFQEELWKMSWNGNLGSSIGKSPRLVIWRSEVRISIQVQHFLLNSKSKWYYILYYFMFGFFSWYLISELGLMYNPDIHSSLISSHTCRYPTLSSIHSKAVPKCQSCDSGGH